MLFLFLTGCADFLALEDAFNDLTNPLVVQAWYVGVEPLPDGLELGDSAWANGSSARVLMADASNLDDLANAPVTDATVAIRSATDEIPLRGEAAGTWVADSSDGLAWTPDEDTVVAIERDGDHALTLTTPEAPTLGLPTTFAVGDPMVVDLEGQPFDNVLVTVVRLEDGVTVYDSTPTDIEALYKLTHASGSLSVAVPGDVFATPGAYAVGVAGLVNADPDDYDGVNLALSALTGGAIQFAAVTVHP